MNDKLRECPLCGGEAEHSNRRESSSCTNSDCFMSNHWVPDDQWNTRHEPKHETVEQLWKALDCDYGKLDKSGLYVGDLHDSLSMPVVDALEKWYIANHHGKPEDV